MVYGRRLVCLCASWNGGLSVVSGSMLYLWWCLVKVWCVYDVWWKAVISVVSGGRLVFGRSLVYLCGVW